MYPRSLNSSLSERLSPCDDTVTKRDGDTKFDPLERHTMTLARLLFLSFHQPKTQSWKQAFQLSDSLFGKYAGAVLAKAVMDMVDSLRAARTSGFAYCDPFCSKCSPFLTNEERYFLDVLHYVRRGKERDARTQAMLLCEGADTGPFIASVRVFVRHTEHFNQSRENLLH